MPAQPNDTRDAALGAILGACVGDAAGSVLEFVTSDLTPARVDHAMTLPGGGCWRVAPGQITDDGELTLCLARALAEGGFDLERIARSYAKWIDSPPFDIGTTTRNGIGCIHESQWAAVSKKDGYAVAMTRAAAERNTTSKANGSLMRAAPLGVWGASAGAMSGGELDVRRIAECAIADSRLSHPNPSAADAVACYAIAIATLIRTLGDREAAFSAAESWAEASAVEEVRRWLADARRGKDVAYVPQIGFVCIGFTHAFRHLAAGTGYAAAIRETIAGGGDTDTNACIVGGLIGAACGAESIPTAMRERVLRCTTEDGRSRPEWLYACQVPELVDRILAISAKGA